MNKLARIIETLAPNELILLQKDLQAGNLQRLIDTRLAQYESGPQKTCPVCGTEVAQNESIRLEFGPKDLRKQAHFDATDCLTHFIENNLKKQEESHIP